ncbi:AIM24 family protein [Nocardia sp. NPDC088792]|uniref:AIM24 family protein n=1 Tax=Nocardia sp. NPDC088792 TaxID=3364332 RepID=UPI00381BC385
MTTLARGENRPAPGDRMLITVTSAAPLDVSALLLGPDGKVRADGDFIFFNQPIGPGVTYRNGAGGPDLVDIRTSALPPEIDTVIVTASLDGTGPTTFAAAGQVTAIIESDTATLTFPMTGLATETAVVGIEIYRRADTWKVRAVGQGYDDGLTGIATAFGVNIDDEPEPMASRTVPGAHETSATPPPPIHPLNPPNPSPGQGDPPPAIPGAPVYPPMPLSNQVDPPVPPTTFTPQQGAQPMQSDLFSPAHAEVRGAGIQKQNGKMIRVAVNGEVMARAGSMVAYQGDLKFQALGAGGIGRAIQQRLTGEGVPLMKVSGRGDLFLANGASDVHTIDLDGTDGLTINGANVLAFDPSLRYDIRLMQGAAGYASNAGFFNCVFAGRGRIAIITHGHPVVLNVDQATYADPQAAVAWSSGLQTGIKRNDSFGFGRLIGRSTGEGLTLAFSGQGFVVVQPSEQPPGGFLGGEGRGQQAGQNGGMLGGIFG